VKRARRYVVALLLLGGVRPATAAPHLTATATWNSNVTNADRAPDEIGALALQAELGLWARRVALGRDDSLLLAALASAEAWPRFDGLDKAGGGARLTWEHKFGLGPMAPVFSVAAGVDGVAARETGRSGIGGFGRAAWRMRIDEATQVVASYERTRHDARQAVFDRTGSEGTVEMMRELDDRWRARLGVRWREGDVLSYATPPRPDLVALARVRTLVDTFHEPRIAYALAAHSIGGFIGVGRALDEQTAVLTGYEYRDTTRPPLRYVNHLVSVTLNRQF
jgi:hypothetical protein